MYATARVMYVACIFPKKMPVVRNNGARVRAFFKTYVKKIIIIID